MMPGIQDAIKGQASGHSRRILVTGGAGFIGSHLIETLIGMGQRVYCLDNYQTGRVQNLCRLAGHPNLTMIEGDVVNPIDLDVDEIYNLACPASPIKYQRDPIGTMRTCVMGALSVLDLARRTGARVLQASTSEVYGDPLVHPQTETYFGNVNPNGPRACYDEGKRCAETLFFDYHRTARVRIKVARIFNTYGPRMQPDDGRVVSTFITQALNGASISIYGDGTQTRSLCHVADLVGGLVRLMATDDEVTGPFNLGNPQEQTIKQIAELVLRLTSSTSRLSYLPLPEDDPRRRQPDISLAHRILGWKPNIALELGLADTITHFRRDML